MLCLVLSNFKIIVFGTFAILSNKVKVRKSQKHFYTNDSAFTLMNILLTILAKYLRRYLR